MGVRGGVNRMVGGGSEVVGVLLDGFGGGRGGLVGWWGLASGVGFGGWVVDAGQRGRQRACVGF